MTTMPQVIALLEEIGTGKTIVEIGCYLGETTRAIALKGNKVIAIDPFLGGYDSKDTISNWLSEEKGKKIKETFLNNIRDLDVVFMQLKGIDAYRQIDLYCKGEADGIFIDSLHTFEGVKEDSIWINKVKKGGLLCFHDYSPSFKGVMDFIDEEIIPNYPLIRREGSLMIFKNEKIIR